MEENVENEVTTNTQLLLAIQAFVIKQIYFKEKLNRMEEVSRNEPFEF